VSGSTPNEERDALLSDYQDGRLEIVFNCMVLTEGFDAPKTGAVLMIAPTKSDLVYTQRLGRGLRTADGKSDCRVLDFAPLEDRNVVMAGDVLGKPREIRKAEEDAARQGVLIAMSVNSLGEAAMIDPQRLVVRMLNLLGKDALAWTMDGIFATASLSKDETLCIILPDPARVGRAEQMKRSGEWGEREARAFEFVTKCRLYRVNGSARLVGSYPTVDDAKSSADALAMDVMERAPRQDGYMHHSAKWDKKATWRKDEPSAKQLGMLRGLGVDMTPSTKGEAAQIITHALTKRAVEAADRRALMEAMNG